MTTKRNTHSLSHILINTSFSRLHNLSIAPPSNTRISPILATRPIDILKRKSNRNPSAILRTFGWAAGNVARLGGHPTRTTSVDKQHRVISRHQHGHGVDARFTEAVALSVAPAVQVTGSDGVEVGFGEVVDVGEGDVRVAELFFDVGGVDA